MTENPIRLEIVRWLAQNAPLDEAQIGALLTAPPSADMGDYALPCFTLAREMKKAPPQIAADLAAKFKPTAAVQRASAAGPYLNFSVNRPAMASWVLRRIRQQGPRYGTDAAGAGKTIVIDYSSPNIAKHLGVHHLRSAIIGRSLYRIFQALGYRCVGINHLGDWGTSFGKLIAAVELWNKSDEDMETLSDLDETYREYSRSRSVKLDLDDEETSVEHLTLAEDGFDRAAAGNPDLQEKARRAFKRLEMGDPDAKRMWEKFRRISLDEFERIYKLLGIEFDDVRGESFYVDMTGGLLARMQQSGLAQLSEGALIVPLEEHKLPAFLLRKNDGTTLYNTRDLCAAEYRWDKYKFECCVYVVGGEQKLYFQQLRKVLSLMGHEWADRIEHIDFGLVKFLDEETGRARKGSTRTGDRVLLEEVLNQGISKARDKIRENIEKLEENADVEALAAQVGIGAVVFSDLSVRRAKDVIFDWDRMLDFEGDTGPYVQYAHARLCSILRKAGQPVTPEADCALLTLPEEWALVRMLEDYPSRIAAAAEAREPSFIASCLLDLCALFSTYYSAGMREPARRVLCDEPAMRAARLLLVDAVRHVIASGLHLLGVAAPERM